MLIEGPHVTFGGGLSPACFTMVLFPELTPVDIFSNILFSSDIEATVGSWYAVYFPTSTPLLLDELV